MDSATTFTDSVEPTSIISPEKQEKGAVDFSKIASEREASHASFKDSHFTEDHSQK